MAIEVFSNLQINLLFDIAVIIVFATIITFLVRLLKQPLIIGYIIAGIILGPSFLQLIKNEEIIFFTEELEQIDITPFIRETMQLSTPIKIICGESCMGLCSHCGVNLNIKSCNCKSRKKRLPFEKLNQLISN